MVGGGRSRLADKQASSTEIVVVVGGREQGGSRQADKQARSMGLVVVVGGGGGGSRQVDKQACRKTGREASRHAGGCKG